MGLHCESCPARELHQYLETYGFHPVAKLQWVKDIAAEEKGSEEGKAIFDRLTLQVLGESRSEFLDCISVMHTDEITHKTLCALRCREHCNVARVALSPAA